VTWFNDFIRRFSQETKPRPQKLANIIDRLTPALDVKSYNVLYNIAARCDAADLSYNLPYVVQQIRNKSKQVELGSVTSRRRKVVH